MLIGSTILSPYIDLFVNLILWPSHLFTDYHKDDILGNLDVAMGPSSFQSIVKYILLKTPSKLLKEFL